MAQWKLAPRIFHLDIRRKNDFAGGINNGDPPFALQDNQSTEEYGWDTDQTPALHTRKGRSPYGSSGADVTNLLTNFNTAHLVRAVGPTLQYNNAGTWTNIAGVFANADWDSTNFEISSTPYLLLTNGTDAVKKWDGTTLSDLNANAPKGKYITNDTYRIFIALGDNLYFCGLNDATDWISAQNSGILRYLTPNGGDITGVRNFYGDKYVWKADCFSTLQGTDYFNYRFKEISNQVGCVCFKTIQEVQAPSGSMLFWLGQNEVYQFSGGTPSPIGQRIRGYLDSINKAYWSRCFGATDGLKYYLGLVTGTNTQPDTLLVFDPRYNIWRVSSLNDNFRYSAILNSECYIGDSSGQTFHMNQGTSDNGTVINSSWTSKPFDEGDPETEKEYSSLHIQCYMPTGSTISIYASTDDRGPNFTLVDTVTASSVAQNQNIIIPFDTVNLAFWMRYKLVCTGEVVIYGAERMAHIQPIQI